MKKRTSKLNLNKETVRTLSNPDLGQVNGGGFFKLTGGICFYSVDCLSQDRQAPTQTSQSSQI